MTSEEAVLTSSDSDENTNEPHASKEQMNKSRLTMNTQNSSATVTEGSPTEDSESTSSSENLTSTEDSLILGPKEEDKSGKENDASSQADQATSKTYSRELKSILELAKEANLNTNIVHKRNSTEPNKNAEAEGRQTPTKRTYSKGRPKAIDENSELKKENEVRCTKISNKRKSIAERALVGFTEEKRSRRARELDLGFLKKNKDPFCWRCNKNAANPEQYSSMYIEGISCETCPRSYHFRCIKQSVNTYWQCPECICTMQAENLKTRSPSLKLMDLEHLCTLLKFALRRMMQIADSEPFLHPVNEKEFPDYKNYIIYPMDLTKLEKNIQNNVYGSTNAFEAEAKWILHNSIIYNSYQSKLTSTAKAILKVCKQEMSEIETCSSCYLNANTKENWFVEVCPKPHSLLWAKLKGFPYWPAKAMCTNSLGLVDVRFFGAHDRAWVSYKDCYLYSDKNPNSNQLKKNDINECIKEVEIYIENLRKKYGTFRYATYKTPFDPDQDSLQVYLPKYVPNEPGNKSVKLRRSESKSSLSNSTKSQGDSPESSMKDIGNMDLEFSDEDESRGLDTSESNAGHNGANTEIIEKKSNDSPSNRTDVDQEEVKADANIANKTKDSEIHKKGGATETKIKISDKLFKKLNLTAGDECSTLKDFGKVDLKPVQTNDNDSKRISHRANEMPLPPLVPFHNSRFKNVNSYEENDLLEILYSEKIDGSKLDPIEVDDDEPALQIVVAESSELPIFGDTKSDSKLDHKTINEQDTSEIEKNNVEPDIEMIVTGNGPVIGSTERENTNTGKLKEIENDITDDIIEQIESITGNNTDAEMINCYKKDVFDESSTIEISKILRGPMIELKSNDKQKNASVNGKTRKKRKLLIENKDMPIPKKIRSPESNETTVLCLEADNSTPDTLESTTNAKYDDLVEVKSESLSDDESLKNVETKDNAYMLAKHKLLEALNISEKVNDGSPKPKSNEMRTRSRKTYLKPKPHSVNLLPPFSTNSKDKDNDSSSGKKFDAKKHPNKSSTPKQQRARKSFPNSRFTSVEKEFNAIRKELPVTLNKSVDCLNNDPVSVDKTLIVEANTTVVTTPTTVITTSCVTTQPTPPQNVMIVPQSIVIPTTLNNAFRNNTFLTMVPQNNTPYANIFLPQTQNFIPTSNLNLTPVNSDATPAQPSDETQVPNLPDPNEPLNPKSFNVLNGILQDNIPKMMANILYSTPPVLKPRPPGPLSTNFDSGIPSSAGPMTSQINSVAHRFSDYFRGVLIETLTDIADKTENTEALVANLRLENEALKHKHNEEILEIKKNVNSILQDIQKSIIDERENMFQVTKAACELETLKRIDEAKSKQWCANCLKEAQFYCCWNTSYCDYPCQTKHWSKHMSKCTQNTQALSSQGIPNKVTQPLVLRPTAAPLKGFTGKALIGKTTKLYVNKAGSKLPINIVRTSAPNLTLLESSPGNFELVGNGQITTENCTNLNKLMANPALINKIKSANIISVSSANSSSQSSMPIIIHQSKSPSMLGKLDTSNEDAMKK